MYLPRLYRYNKWLFAAILFFVAMQLLVTYKRGMVISPWYQYGMYSEKIYPKKMYEVNQQLSGPKWFFQLSPQYDDKINLTLDNYRRLSENDSLYLKEIVRLFPVFHLPVPEASFYQSSLSEKEFNTWFKKYRLQSLSAADSQIVTKTAIWNGKELKVSGSPLPNLNGTILLP